jgi:hypothetical protein
MDKKAGHAFTMMEEEKAQAKPNPRRTPRNENQIISEKSEKE